MSDFPSVGDGEKWELVNGDCLDVLKTFADESIDACVCDPPYGLSAEPDIVEVMKHWVAGDTYAHKSNGFMGKSWDSFVPGPEYWREVYRVLKPGGHLLAFAGTRTFDLMAVAIRFAGFENRDTISAEGMLRWCHGTGFPKSKTVLKPAWEPILVFRKFLDGTVVSNVLKYGTGALNIDGCRIAYQNDADKASATPQGRVTSGTSERIGAKPSVENKDRQEFERPEQKGRWPANLVISHLSGCKQVGISVVKGDPREGGDGTRPGGFVGVGADKGSGEPCGKLYGDEEVPVYECIDGCPVAELNRQSSGASRFFYQSKASRKERELGLDSAANTHPTVKSIELMRWLVRLVGCKPGSVVLDPFAGSGTTLIAALLEGFKAVGIEQDANYTEIARKRIEWWQQHPEGK